MVTNATATQYVQFSISSPSGSTSYSVRLAKWLDGQHRLLPIYEYGEFARNADDTHVSFGPIVNQRYQMTGTVLLTQSEAENIDLINQVSCAHIRAKTGNEGIIVDYMYKEIHEFGPRSRALAAGTTATVINGEAVRYYPKFRMQPRVWELTDDFRTHEFSHQLTFEMEELGRIAP